MNKKTKKRIRNLERRTAYLADMLDITAEHQSGNLTEFENIKQQLAYLESMVRHYIALHEQNRTASTSLHEPKKYIGLGTAYEALRSSKLPEGDGR